MTPAERAILAHVRRSTDEELVAAWNARRPDEGDVDDAMADRWTALAILGELLRRDRISLLS